MKNKDPNSNSSLLDQHLRLMKGDVETPGDQEELNRVEGLSLPSLTPVRSSSKLIQTAMPLTLAAGILLSFFTLSEFSKEPDHTLPKGIASKGGDSILVYKQRFGAVKKFDMKQGPLQEQDKISVEAISGQVRNVYLGIYRGNGERLNSKSSFLGSHTYLEPGQAKIIPAAFALTGASEKEFLVVYFCNSSNASDQTFEFNLELKSRDISENESFINDTLQCKITKKTLRN